MHIRQIMSIVQPWKICPSCCATENLRGCVWEFVASLPKNDLAWNSVSVANFVHFQKHLFRDKTNTNIFDSVRARAVLVVRSASPRSRRTESDRNRPWWPLQRVSSQRDTPTVHRLRTEQRCIQCCTVATPTSFAGKEAYKNCLHWRTKITLNAISGVTSTQRWKNSVAFARLPPRKYSIAFFRLALRVLTRFPQLLFLFKNLRFVRNGDTVRYLARFCVRSVQCTYL